MLLNNVTLWCSLIWSWLISLIASVSKQFSFYRHSENQYKNSYEMVVYHSIYTCYARKYNDFYDYISIIFIDVSESDLYIALPCACSKHISSCHIETSKVWLITKNHFCALENRKHVGSNKNLSQNLGIENLIDDFISHCKYLISYFYCRPFQKGSRVMIFDLLHFVLYDDLSRS